MGHHQLLGMARTPLYKRVISLIGNGADAGIGGVAAGSLEEIVDATLVASEAGLIRARNDEGLGYCIYLMVELTRVSTQENFVESLAALGITLSVINPVQHAGEMPPEFTVFDLVSAFGAKVDQHVFKQRARTDIGEMAHLAASETLSVLCGRRAITLFGTTQETVQSALRNLTTERGFASLIHEFFARLSRRYIEYHLSRELSNHVGPGRRFISANDHNTFLQNLDDHCRLTTGVLRQFAAGWYRKRIYHNDFSLKKAKHFTAHAVDKMRDAINYQEGRNEN